jgi:hypothetical protein
MDFFTDKNGIVHPITGKGERNSSHAVIKGGVQKGSYPSDDDGDSGDGKGGDGKNGDDGDDGEGGGKIPWAAALELIAKVLGTGLRVYSCS